MKVVRKIELEAMPIETLEVEKRRMFTRILKGDKPKKYRNLLYELLGVIEWKKRFNLDMV